MQCTASGTTTNARAPSPTDSDPSSDPSSAPSSSDSQDSSFVRRHTESTDPELERLLFAMIAAVLDAQCEANRDLRNEAPTRFDSISRQPISTVDYLARLRDHTRFDRLCFPIALGLLLRLCGSAGADHPDSFVRSHRFCPTYHNVHRLVIAALLVASKLNDDVHHFNRHMSECGGVSLAELNALELELCTRLRWRLVLGKDEFARVVDALRDPASRVWRPFANPRPPGEPMTRPPERAAAAAAAAGEGRAARRRARAGEPQRPRRDAAEPQLPRRRRRAGRRRRREAAGRAGAAVDAAAGCAGAAPLAGQLRLLLGRRPRRRRARRQLDGARRQRLLARDLFGGRPLGAAHAEHLGARRAPPLGPLPAIADDGPAGGAVELGRAAARGRDVEPGGAQEGRGGQLGNSHPGRPLLELPVFIQ